MDEEEISYNQYESITAFSGPAPNPHQPDTTYLTWLMPPGYSRRYKPESQWRSRVDDSDKKLGEAIHHDEVLAEDRWLEHQLKEVWDE